MPKGPHGFENNNEHNVQMFSGLLDDNFKHLGPSVSGADLSAHVSFWPGRNLQAFDQNPKDLKDGSFPDIFSVIAGGVSHPNAGTEEALLRDKVMNKMTAAEKQQYQREEKDIAAYNFKVAAESNIIGSVPLKPIEYPETKMHGEIDLRIINAESKIADDVKKQMSPADLQRLDTQYHSFVAMQENYIGHGKKYSPYIPVPIEYGPKPVAGNTLRDYYDRVAEAVDQY